VRIASGVDDPFHPGIESLVTFSPPEVPSYSPRLSHRAILPGTEPPSLCFSLATSVEFMISISIVLRRKGRRDDRPTVSTVGISTRQGGLGDTVTFRQMFTFKTTIEGNTRSYFKWFSNRRTRQLAYLLFNVVTNSVAYHSTTGIWLQGAVEFAIFMTALIIANRKCARLIHPSE